MVFASGHEDCASDGILRLVTKVLTPIPEAWQQSWDSFDLSGERSKETMRVYRTSLADFGQYLIATKGSAIQLAAVTGDDVLRYLRELKEAGKAPATRHMRFRGLRTIFGWLAEKHVAGVEVNPVVGVKAPKLDKLKTTVISPADVKRLLATCRGGTDFKSSRDYALLRMLLEGPRRGEVVSMQVDKDHLHLTPPPYWAKVTGKTGTRTLDLEKVTAGAISLYRGKRDAHPYAGSSALWLGSRGPLTVEAVYTVVELRTKQAGLEGIHPHVFRHTFAHNWLDAGGSEGGLMRAAGWKSRSMLDRYASSHADDRARDEHQRLDLGARYR
jgi:site-specific recombinase XerD